MIRYGLALIMLAASWTVNAVADEAASAALLNIEDRWAQIRYDMKDSHERLQAAQALAQQSKALVDQSPGVADVLVWHALVLLVEAEIRHDLSALSIAKEAKDLLERAEQIDSRALDGTIHTTLGVLYDEVPGWPVGFGDSHKATAHLAKALEIAPAAMDPNYFYGDYLLQHDKPREAVAYLEKALQASPRPGHERAETGRRTEIAEDLDAAQKKLKK